MIPLRLASLAAAAALAGTVLAQQPFRLVFANTNLSSVLRAIGLRSGANIVYVGTEDPAITLNVTAGSTDEALRFATTAAGVTYRRVGNTYVVAKPENMRRALEPFGLRYLLPLTKMSPAEATAVLNQALPFLTVQQAGTQVLLTGTRDDIDQAREIIRQQEESTTRSPLVTEVVPVRIVAPSQVASVLGELYPDIRFRVIGQGQAGGSLVMTGPANSIAQARATLALIDTANPLPGAEEIYQVYEIRYSSASVLINFMSRAMPDVEVIAAPESYSPPAPGFNPLSGASVAGSSSTGAGSAGTGASRPMSAAPETTAANVEKSKRLVIRGPRSRVDAAVRLLAELDIRPKQVMVEVKVVDYSPSKDSEIGFQWEWTRFGFYETPPGTPIDVGTFSGGVTGEPIRFATRPAGFGTFSRVPFTFASFLQAAVTRREARLLATPSVQVIDNEDANIFIGDTIRARVASTGALGGQTVEIVEFPIGIILLIRPRVNANGDITLRVHPVVSTVTALDANNVPQTSTREAETTMVVKDGETMVLGGLIRDEMTKVVREVPLLSQLPIVGELFRSTTKNGRKSEILIFITPRIIDAAGEGSAPGAATPKPAAAGSPQ